MDNRNRLRRCGGCLAKYALTDLNLGDDLGERLPMLDDEPLRSNEIIILPFVAVTSSSYADVHILGARTGKWIIFLDRTSEAETYRALQQRVNESSLLEDRLLKVTNELAEARKIISSLEERLLALNTGLGHE